MSAAAGSHTITTLDDLPKEIHVQHPNGRITLQVKLSDLVRDVKTKIQAQLNIPPAQQKLVYDKKELEDGQSLSDQGVSGGCTLHLSVAEAPQGLTQEDLATIKEFLQDYSPLWRQFGTFLHFTGKELDLIQSKPQLFMGAPNTYLDAMLDSYQAWKPGDKRGTTKYPSPEDVADAVDKAGLGRPAAELRALFRK